MSTEGQTLTWEWFTGFVGPGRWRAVLPGDRRNAWIIPPINHAGVPDVAGDFRWSVEDNTCALVLAWGYEETLDAAMAAAAAAAAEYRLRKAAR
ncbi:hypothetical protein PHATNISS_61 [Mycobacterium phage Phatniss]|uniref:Uncharacterized protein n=4 Tax=Cheoctovirus TaxID=1623281 RepID=A0A2P1JR12_9CAUD|nr:hypothetical protein CL68_gp060 [Mycobacterium phage Drago]YP_009202578.1 hypothetical protein PHATNISS_61 [Mycobacterium phage Phatniss]YP_655055.1 hypothetical protein Llijp59 [Mycobacterium phage Llij]AVO21563.1 hypothetical protein PBI_UNCLERICKY_62 [Mycobacterium phage UncleRicky]QGJ89566.1 hypothetical protein PBI_ENBY_64 [Mycobacterium phage Enby]QGJ91249.1 hypothetical protein PBI_LORDE_63 [Mycobacterium phage Lorde]UAJ16049.1 hypothetical protein SEA_DIRTMCGIRT_62 [Mycobacterium p